MTRKDLEKDADRPHYYSQFWLDVAAGRRIIGQPKPEEGEGAEPEPEVAAPPRRPARATQTEVSDARADNIVHPVAEPIVSPDPFIEPDSDEFADADDLDLGTAIEDEDIPDMDLGVDEDDEDDEGFEEDEEDEEDIGWGGGRGRKKAKPTRPTKPTVKKTTRREPRRGY